MQLVSDTITGNQEQVTPLYHWKSSVKNRIESIAKEIYGNNGIVDTAKPQCSNFTVHEIEIAAGAGFLIPITGNMMRIGLALSSYIQGYGYYR